MNNKYNFITLVIIFLLLDVIYINSISRVYGYMGFTIRQPNPFSSILIYLFVSLVSFLSIYKAKLDFSKIIVQLILILFTFPALVFYKNSNLPIDIPLAHALFFFTTYFSLEFINIKPFRYQFVENQKKYFLLFFLVILSLPFLVVFKFNINFRNLLLIDIYETRLLQRNLSNQFLSYIYSQIVNVLLPISFIYFFNLKLYKLSFYVCLLLIYFFLIGAHKSVLFGFVIVLLGLRFRYILNLFPLLVLVTLFVDFVAYNFFNNYFISGLVTRRVFFVPALLDKYYFSFFLEKHLYWSHSFLSSFIDYPYKLKPAYLIGRNFFGNSQMSANNGLISDGFANFGWLGVLINVLIFSFYVSYLKSLRISSKYFSIIIILLVSFLSSALPVVLVTHGGIFLLFVAQYILINSSDSDEFTDLQV